MYNIQTEADELGFFRRIWWAICSRDINASNY